MTLDYIVDLLEETGAYEVEMQPFSVELMAYSHSNLAVSGFEWPPARTNTSGAVGSGIVPSARMWNSKNGTFEGLQLIWTNSCGCNGVC